MKTDKPSSYRLRQQRNEHDYKAQFNVTDEAVSITAHAWRYVQIRKGRRGPDEGSRQEMQVYETFD